MEMTGEGQRTLQPGQTLQESLTGAVQRQHSLMKAGSKSVAPAAPASAHANQRIMVCSWNSLCFNRTLRAALRARKPRRTPIAVTASGAGKANRSAHARLRWAGEEQGMP